ncbi:MAG: hypothetical protein WD960_08220 [Gemmatimonadota bacterium]
MTRAADTESRPPKRPADRATRKAETAREHSGSLGASLARISRFRTGAFLVAAAALLLLETSPRDVWPFLLGVAAVGAAAFAVLVRRHRRTRAKMERANLEALLQDEALARMERRWDQAPLPKLPDAHRDHAYAADLNVLGRGSLAHLLGRVNTAPGKAALRHILLDPLRPLPPRIRDLLAGQADQGSAVPLGRPPGDWMASIAARQSAVQRLSEDPDLMDAVELAGRESTGDASLRRTVDFLEWAEGAPWLASRPATLWGSRILALFNVATLIAWLSGALTAAVWAPGLVLAYLLNRSVAREAYLRFAAAEGGDGDPARWAALLDRATELPEDEPTLAGLRTAAATPSPGAGASLRALRRLNDVAAVRYSGLVHFPLAALVAWDVHVLHALERWQRAFGPDAHRWVRAVAELELLTSLAGLRHENPDWRFPGFSPAGEGGICGRDLGHPLLPPSECVGNDVELPAPGRLLLVTGSNMAGKTTLLRALGANQVLALAGAPVAAGALDTAPILPWTAMRVRDSLTDGVSLFMAELQRLRRVVDAARREPVLFLLDEILQGTNSAERRTAARIVLRHLLASESVGAATTHDLTLAQAPDLKERSIDVHFREDVREIEGVRRLDFDYRLRAGPATSRNALILLDMVGLGDPDAPGTTPEDADDGG